jgi:hypothetical protein
VLGSARGTVDLDEVATAREYHHPQRRDGEPDSVPGTLVMMKGCGPRDDFILTPWAKFRDAWKAGSTAAGRHRAPGDWRLAAFRQTPAGRIEAKYDADAAQLKVEAP